MKDAFGHGSNLRGGVSGARGEGAQGAFWDALRARLPNSRVLKGNDGGGQPMSSNAAAVASLTNSLKSTQAPVHPAMAMQSGNSVVHQFRDGPRGSRSFGDRPITNLKGSHH